MKSKEPYQLAEKSTNKGIPFMEPGVISKLFHTHLMKVFKIDQEKINFHTLFEAENCYAYENNLKEFKKIEKSEIWEKYLKNEKNFLQVVFEFLGWRYKAGILLDLLGVLFTIPIPILVKSLIDWLSRPEDSGNNNGFLLCGVIVVFMLLNYMLKHTALHNLAYGRAQAESFCRV